MSAGKTKGPLLRTARSGDQTFRKFDENTGVNATFFLDHEAHVTARRDRRATAP